MLLFLLACSGAAPGDKPDDTGPVDTSEPLPGSVTLGAACPLDERIGEVGLWLSGEEAYVEGKIYDTPDPWIGPAARETATCQFHQFSTASCGTCEADEVCGFDGACVPARRALPATLDVARGGATETFTADAATGDLYGSAGPADGAYTLTLTVDGQALAVPELTLAAAIADLSVTGTGDSMAPTSLTAAWPPTTDGGRVRTVIPINHHAAGPTFTRCDVEGALGGFSADAEMLAPLAVVTGLEFQGVEHAHTAAARIDRGCVDVRLGRRDYIGVEWDGE